MEIRELTQATITDADADELARLRSLVDPRRHHLDKPVTRQLAINELRPSAPTFSLKYWGFFEGDRLIALGESAGAINAENADVCQIGIWVDPAHQDDDHVITRKIFDFIDEFERARGRTRYWGWGAMGNEATRSFWEDVMGYSLAQDERVSRCVLAETDAELMQSWIDGASERASDYHLEATSAPMSDRLVEFFAQGLMAMNDAPLDDLEHEPDVFDAARAREIEQLHLGTRSEYRALFAVHTPTDTLAGYTALRIPDAEPERSMQSDTVTLAAHRNRGIGRWMKAQMWQWLQAERPQVQSLDTGNAESNRAMLAINEEMGFRDTLHHGVWHRPS